MLSGKGRERVGARALGGDEGSVEPTSRILCFGGATVDRTYVAERAIRPGTSNPASGARSFGGVAHNVAVNLARLGVPTSLVSAVGDDPDGATLIDRLETFGIDAAGVAVLPGQRTAEYVALLEPDRSLALGLADMAIFDAMTLEQLECACSRLGPVAWIFADCNLSGPVLRALITGPSRGSARLAIDAVSTPKVERLPPDLTGIDLLFLNLDEAAALVGASAPPSPEGAVQDLCRRGVRQVVLTLGAEGLVLCGPSGAVQRLPSVSSRVVDVTGAGDAAIATTLAYSLHGHSLVEAARWGTLAAALTLEQLGSVRPDLSTALLESVRHRISGQPAQINPEADDE